MQVYIEKVCTKCNKLRKFPQNSEQVICRYCKMRDTYKKTCLEKYGVENAFQNAEVRKKHKQTCLERYGVENVSQVASVKEKKKQTSLEHYGVENPNQSETVKSKIKSTCLEKYGVENFLQSEQAKESYKKTCLGKYGVEHPSKLDEVKDRRKQTCLEKYGVENPNQAVTVKDQKKQTNLERYGVEYSIQSVEVKNKAKQACMQRFGVEQPFQAKEVRDKIKQTNLERYGVENPFQVDEIKAKIRQINLEKYGAESPLQSTEIKEKMQTTVLDKYGVKNISQNEVVKDRKKQTSTEHFGVDHPWKSPELQEKIKQTNLKRFGVEHPSQSEVVKEKQRKTCLERYGTEYYLQSEEAAKNRKQKYSYMNQSFDSKPELAFFIWCKDHNMNVQRNTKGISYFVNDKEHIYIPDFEVDGDLYELKGNQFLSSEGCWQNPFDTSRNELYESKHQAALKNGVKILYTEDYQKYLNYVNDRYTQDFLNLFNVKLPFPYINEDLKDRSDTGLIQHFHKSVYEAARQYKPSPKEAWQDKELVRKVALNRLKYVKSCTPNDIRQGFSVTRLAPKVSIFSPKLATDLISRYLNDFKVIVDPFSGFSGRLLGSIACKKYYLGKDIHPDHVKESNEIIDYKQVDKSAYKVMQEDILRKQDVEQCDCLFTCPPYGGKEHWNVKNDEVEKSCDEWIDICLEKYKCKRYLFVVDRTEKYENYIVERLNKKEGLFRKTEELVICIDSEKLIKLNQGDCK